MYLWENHLAFSSYLLENFSNIDAKHREAALRTIIHNDYYACFHKVKQLDELHGYSTVGGGNNSHNDVIDKIRNYNVDLTLREKQKIIRELKEMKDYRRKADYKEGASYIFKIEIVTDLHQKSIKLFETLRDFESNKNQN